MDLNRHRLNRRQLTTMLGALSLWGLLPAVPGRAQSPAAKILTRKIPKTGEEIPVIGMGTWITFNVGKIGPLRNARTEVLAAFFEGGGGLIDSSPMYGSSEEVLGYGLQKLGYPKGLFSATKVWTSSAAEGPKQLADSKRLWGLSKLDLYQIHNLLGWKDHLKLLRERKEKGEIRYIGITTSHGRRHDDFIRIMKTEPLDFIQLTYNIADREAESKLLPLAAEKNIAVIVNRPYQGGALIDSVQRKPFPDGWRQEFDCKNWPEFLLKFIVSHPAVTCAIPATSQVVHMRENMGAATGRLPDARGREQMLKKLAAL